MTTEKDESYTTTFRQQCGIGHFANDVLLQSIVDELSVLRKESEALEHAGVVDQTSGINSDVSNIKDDLGFIEISNKVKDAVDVVEAQGKELDVLVDELATFDHEFKELIIQAARADKTAAEKQKEYTKQDIKRIVAAASEAGGLQLLDKMQATKDRIRAVFSERHAQWDFCQREIIGATLEKLDARIAELKSRCNLSLEDLQNNPPTAQQAIAHAGILTSMATVDGIWPLSKLAGSTPGHPTPGATSSATQSATANHV
eukprot:Gregarina_sp_Pseudo_9__1722@NODE_2168_length_1116_cov_36_183844_g1996_i0_p1_GENE_NODE_2168_length_1116_cov_36_183844_g1996_i0NODE_2168_length_1116_cov_36_183844_g1996_i0_p1_ORF_typecomplete_len259_score46_85GldM_N/PF12081_8/0_0027GvpK/PF05121_12/1_6e03GvpK/PF05121_12/0_091HNOB/PF07700_15/0_071POTRA_2/PF08479_11/1_3e03POTRA_2/PF08479_11/0_57DUF4201/PF13870_6/4_3e02DUF4201/PF13870_6/1_2Ead_Ea22/PF13935_6/2_8Dynamin_M/PF01031_20/2_8e02Dynamin_M/PF01031_20/76Dynamin_M/PF01031_20/9_7_NODE_2168_length